MGGEEGLSSIEMRLRPLMDFSGTACHSARHATIVLQKADPATNPSSIVHFSLRICLENGHVISKIPECQAMHAHGFRVLFVVSSTSSRTQLLLFSTHALAIKSRPLIHSSLIAPSPLPQPAR